MMECINHLEVAIGDTAIEAFSVENKSNYYIEIFSEDLVDWVTEMKKTCRKCMSNRISGAETKMTNIDSRQ